MSRKFQFSLKTMLLLMLAVACFFGGIRFERERRRRADYEAECAEWERKTASVRQAIAEGRISAQTPVPPHPSWRYFWKDFVPSADNGDF